VKAPKIDYPHTRGAAKAAKETGPRDAYCRGAHFRCNGCRHSEFCAPFPNIERCWLCGSADIEIEWRDLTTLSQGRDK